MNSMVSTSATTVPNLPPASGATPFRRRFERGLPILGGLVLLLILPTLALTPALLAAPVGAPHAGPAALAAAPPGPAPGLTAIGGVSSPAGTVLTPGLPALTPAMVQAIGPGRAAAGALQHASVGSDPNRYIQDHSTTTTITQVGSSNQSLLVGLSDQNSFVNGSNIAGYATYLYLSGYFWHHGITAAEFSSNGGQSWTLNSPGPASSWSSGVAAGSIGFGSTWVTGNRTGDALLLEDWGQPCLFFSGSISALSDCNSTANFTAPLGIAVAQSSDSGHSWSSPTVLAGFAPYYFLNIDLGTCGPLKTFLNANQTSDARVSIDPQNGIAVASWWELSYNYAGSIECVSGSYQFSRTVIPTAVVYTSTSSDGGATWSTPIATSDNQSAYSAVAVAGAGSGTTAYLAFADFINSSATGQISIDFASSTNGGASWSVPSGIGTFIRTLGLTYLGYPQGDSFRMAVDASPTSAYDGSIYLAYEDNRSASNGNPSVAVLRSNDGGATWSSPVYVTPDHPTVSEYAIPSIAVDPSGRVWVSFYSININNGNYLDQAVTSTDGGNSWSAPFNVSDAVSSPPLLPNSPFGDLAGIAATGNGTYINWIDCRATACTSPTSAAYDNAAYVAQFLSMNLTSNAPGITAQVTELGATTPTALNSSMLIENGSSVTVSVPAVAPDNGSYVYAFGGFSGAATSLNDPVTFTYTGQGPLLASYTPQPAAWLVGYAGPAVPALQVTVAGPTGSSPVTLSPYNGVVDAFNVTVEAGPSYTLSASAGIAYIPKSTNPLPTTAHSAVAVNLTLSRSFAWLNGSVSVPAGASASSVDLSVNGTRVAVSPGGTFTYHPTWGTYWVHANLTGYTSYDNNVSLPPLGSKQLLIPLAGGYLNGTVTPTSAVVAINGLPVTTIGGTFSTSEPGGVYLLTAEQAGYSFYSRHFTVVPGQALNQIIALTTTGWLSGNVTPGTATLLVNDHFQAVKAGGLYNVTLGGGPHYSIELTQAGYTPFFGNYSVTPGNVTYVPNVTLQKVTNGGGPIPCPPNCTTPGGNNSPPNNLLLYVVIGVLIAVVAGLAVLMAVRRRPGSGSSAPAGEASGNPGTYDGSHPGELPRLQPDGSMEGTPPPPPPYDEGAPRSPPG